MRISTSPLLLALPILGVAAEGAFEQYKAQFQNFLGSFGQYLPKEQPQQAKVPDPEAKSASGTKQLEILTLNNWKQKLYSPVKPQDTTKPEEWWVLVTGRNRTCFGHCLRVEAAFNETALKFATLPKAPHMGYLNCDDEGILCNAWAASAATLWVFEMLPPPAKIDVYLKRLNVTTTTSKDLLELYAQENKEDLKLHDGYFHPFDGPLAANGLALPIGYFLYYFNMVPSWAVMLIVSFASRSMMSRRMNNPGGRPAAAAQAARPAPPGDAAGPR